MAIGITNGGKNSKTQIDTFYGLNRTRRPAKGEFCDMQNLTSDEFPCIAPCAGKTSVAQTEEDICACVAPDEGFASEISGFTGVAGNAFYYNGERKTTIRGYKIMSNLEIDLPSGCTWEIAKQGDTYILNGYNQDTKRSYMFYYDVETDTFSHGTKTMTNMIVAVGNDNVGTYIEAIDNYSKIYDYTVSFSDGTSFDAMDYINLYFYANDAITPTENLFTKYFKAGDELCISGFRSANEGQVFSCRNNKFTLVTAKKDYTGFNTIDLDDVSHRDVVYYDKPCAVYVKSFSVVTAYGSRHKMYIEAYDETGESCQYPTLASDLAQTYYAGVEISVKTPALKSICMHQGRLWGASLSGKYIYASASDDIFSFSDADMVNRYSWRMPSDVSGEVTAMVSYNGELAVFKRQSISIITGTSTRNYQMYTLSGVGAIAPRSVIATSKGIIFLAYGGFYIYNGATPKRFGRCLKTQYIDAVCGYDGRKYYACATLPDGGREMLVYDIYNGLWHCEDDFNAVGYMRFGNDFYVCDNRNLYKLDEGVSVSWDMTLGQFMSFDLGGVNEIWVKAEVYDGAEFTVHTDLGDGIWREHRSFTESGGVKIYSVPVRLRRDNNFRVRLSGHGRVIIHGIETVSATAGRMVE